MFVREYASPQPKYESKDTVAKWPVSDFKYLDECEKQCEFQKSDSEPKIITMPLYDDTMKKWCHPRPLLVEQVTSKAFVGNDELAVTANISITNNDNERLCRHREYNDNLIDLWMGW